MVSSLAAQLSQRNQQKGNFTSNLGQKNRASLLFDTVKAGDVDKDSIFAIGSNGFLELIQKDLTLSTFKEALFSERSKSWERMHETADESKKLDTVINNFLMRVSPLAMQQCTLKALEWLIRQFRINEFNSSELIECFLPYHDTPIFVKIVLIVDLNRAPERWKFLRSIQSNGIPLTRT
ncbi:HEAT repeat-containing protein 1, partial [Nowakowskiella sp. JEL0078]